MSSTNKYSDYPAPPLPAGTDLRNLPWCKHDVESLSRFPPWLACKRNPSAGYYMQNLFDAAWHRVPAGSIEDDDIVLAHLAMCDLDTWESNKKDALRGWTLCSDGRWYSEFLFPSIQFALEERQKYHFQTSEANRVRKEKEAAKKAQKRADEEAERLAAEDVGKRAEAMPANATHDDATSTSRPLDDDATSTYRSRDDHLDSIKRDSIIKKKKSIGRASRSASDGGDNGFDEFWSAYPRKVGKGDAVKAFVLALQKVSAAEILRALRQYTFSPDPKYIPHPARWLRSERWADEAAIGDPVLVAAGLFEVDPAISAPSFLIEGHQQ